MREIRIGAWNRQKIVTRRLAEMITKEISNKIDEEASPGDISESQQNDGSLILRDIEWEKRWR